MKEQLSDIKGLGYKIYVKPDPVKEKTESGIILLESYQRMNHPPETGEVFEVGSKVTDCKVGDRIMFEANGGRQTFYADEIVYVFDERDVALMGIIIDEG